MQVLIVKLSSLGDVVHALPVLHDMHQMLPGVQVDWVVEEGFAPLLGQAHGIRRVIPVGLRRWTRTLTRQPLRVLREFAAFRRDLRQTRYDTVIDIHGLSKSALVAKLARGYRYAMANATQGSSYEAPTRWVADTAIPVESEIHVVQRSRVVCAQALGYALPDEIRFGLGQRDRLTQRPVVALVHGTSRADKEWPITHWVELARRLHGQGLAVAFPHGSSDEQARSELMAETLGAEGIVATVYPRLSLDALARELAQCAGVVGVDSGLSHIAVALDLPHVQIYNFDTAWRTGPLPPVHGPALQRSVYARPTPDVDSVWQAWQQVLAADAARTPG
ncbi:lipopolysaccharide heptosyltransferase I [Pseudorhodoferax sp. Leaf267]|uniref:lipopolysaccharide heptosyltransferase I n=1 Tax=Pseudorhodoferax sp. Leaf267 TaxID=1736316 RepID=UPI0006FD15CC|nr:lipopolysaccharide heptosyltransferase I [Pseudorhodoferax sp. Leaf267]KQP19776.1 lipopolysaccharide heptosyltransferase [Pseudorhodoferax sp. Leaf267]